MACSLIYSVINGQPTVIPVLFTDGAEARLAARTHAWFRRACRDKSHVHHLPQPLHYQVYAGGEATADKPLRYVSRKDKEVLYKHMLPEHEYLVPGSNLLAVEAKDGIACNGCLLIIAPGVVPFTRIRKLNAKSNLTRVFCETCSRAVRVGMRRRCCFQRGHSHTSLSP